MIECQGKCWDSCGIIKMTRVEWDRVLKKRGTLPRGDGIYCPLLLNNRCSVYSVRPLICRLWGVVDVMACPWGCKPEPRYLTSVEAHDFLLRAQQISNPEDAEEIEKLRVQLREAGLSPARQVIEAIIIQSPSKTHE